VKNEHTEGGVQALKQNELLVGTIPKHIPGKVSAHSDLNEIIDASQEDLPGKNKAERYDLVELIAKSKLSVRAINVVLKNVSSGQDLVELDYSELLSFKNCGRKTAVEIMNFIQQLRLRESYLVFSRKESQKQPLSWPSSSPKPPGFTFEEKTKSSLASPPTMDSLDALPFFLSRRLDFLSEEDLHPDYKANLKLSDVEMSARTSKALRKSGYNRLGQVLLIPGVELLRQKGFGRKCLRELKTLVTGLILPETTSDSIINTDYSSYSTMILSLLSSCKINERDQEIILMWLSSKTNNRITFQKIADKFSLSRERIRQIVNKNFRKIRHPARFKMLKEFWNKMDEIIDSGGGLISLDQLVKLVKQEFQWNESLTATALKRLIVQCGQKALFAANDQEKLIFKGCECLDCNVPVQSLSKMFIDTNSAKMNIWVVCKKILHVCQSECTYRASPVSTFHRAFLERAIDKAEDICIMHEDLVFPKNQWDLMYGQNLSHVAYTFLKEHGEPLHFSELAKIIRKKSVRYSDVSDAFVHNILFNHEDVQLSDRGHYGLSSWDIGQYRPASQAIQELLEKNELPMKRQEIIAQLNDEYKDQNISAALGHPKFHRIGEGYYDLSERWSKRTCDDFIAMLSEPMSSFARYVVTNNNFSYKPVMALVFLRGMDKNGFFRLHTLKDRFINFYLARQKKGQLVESESATVSRIGELDVGVIRDRSVMRPLESFINSGFFSKEISTLWLRGDLVNLLADKYIRGIALLSILKGIDDYFARIEISESYKQRPVEYPPKTGEGRLPFSKNLEEETTDGQGDSGPTITIKKKTKGRIRL